MCTAMTRDRDARHACARKRGGYTCSQEGLSSGDPPGVGWTRDMTQKGLGELVSLGGDKCASLNCPVRTFAQRDTRRVLSTVCVVLPPGERPSKDR